MYCLLLQRTRALNLHLNTFLLLSRRPFYTSNCTWTLVLEHQLKIIWLWCSIISVRQCLLCVTYRGSGVILQVL